MKKYIPILILILILSAFSLAGGMNDDPALAMLTVDQLKMRSSVGNSPVAWNVEGSMSKDLNNLWVRTDGEYMDGNLDEMELQTLYNQAFAPYWDLQLERQRQFSPYMGVNSSPPFCQKADFARTKGAGTDDAQLRSGVRVWF